MKLKWWVLTFGGPIFLCQCVMGTKHQIEAKGKSTPRISMDNIEAYLEIEENNLIREFLIDSDTSIYFLDLLKTELKWVRDNGHISNRSSLSLNGIDTVYIRLFNERVISALRDIEFDSISYSLMLPVDTSSKPMPPPPALDFYGNTKGGKIPEYVPNTFLLSTDH